MGRLLFQLRLKHFITLAVGLTPQCKGQMLVSVPSLHTLWDKAQITSFLISAWVSIPLIVLTVYSTFTKHFKPLLPVSQSLGSWERLSEGYGTLTLHSPLCIS